MRYAILWMAWLAACTDGGTVGGKDSGSVGGKDSGTATIGACATQEECPSGEYCFAPGEPNCPVEQSCLGSGCPTGQWCAIADPAFPVCGDSECRDLCTDDAGCRAGAETCDLASGNCVAIRCDAGFACAPHESCVAAAPVHGCVRDTCADDAACADGRCVKGECHDTLGFCSMQAEN